MNPDEERLALWLEDELTGTELEEMDRLMAGQPDHLSAREEARRWKQFVSGALPASSEPPYAELFQARLARKIRETPQESLADAVETSVIDGPARWFFPRRWLMPLASCAGMVLTFWIGTRQAPNPTLSGSQMPVVPAVIDAATSIASIDIAGAPRALPVDAAVYTPDNSVSVEWITGKMASVIVLNGMQPIPDETDFSQTAASGQLREVDLTAGLEP